jgi:hypothetical protein
MKTPEQHDALLRWAKDFLSWLSAGLGITSAMGMINGVIGMLSAAWLATQLWDYWRYKHPEKRRARYAAKAAATVTTQD